MKKVAVVIYDRFCMFEFSVALEMLAMAKIPITIFGEEKNLYRSEEGLLSMPDFTLDELCVDDFDALILTGAQSEEFPIIKNETMMNIIRNFHNQEKILAAISIGPLLLLKAGILKDVPFMVGINKKDLLDEGFTMSEMKDMMEWDECNKHDNLMFIRYENILTSVAYGFREWAMELGNMLEIKTYPKLFGLN